ncbi:MAG: hypothetical protein PGN09_04190 [Sphingomonas fennica]
MPKTVAGRRLSPLEHSQYQELAGQMLHAELAARFKAPEWRRLSDEDKREAVRDVTRDTRKQARVLMFSNGADGGAC